MLTFGRSAGTWNQAHPGGTSRYANLSPSMLLPLRACLTVACGSILHAFAGERRAWGNAGRGRAARAVETARPCGNILWSEQPARTLHVRATKQHRINPVWRRADAPNSRIDPATRY